MNKVFSGTRRVGRRPRGASARSITDAQINALLEMGLAASNGHERRPWHFVVIRDQGLRQRVSDALRGYPPLEVASVMIAPTVRPAPTLATGEDLSALVESIFAGARSLALRALWIGEPTNSLWPLAEEMLLEQLNIPVALGVRIPGLIGLGRRVEGHDGAEAEGTRGACFNGRKDIDLAVPTLSR